MGENYDDALRRQRREERKRHMEYCMNLTMADDSERFDFVEHPLPWTWRVSFHDHLFYQFIDANGRPCLGNDLTEPEDAARILKLVNSQCGR